MATSWYRWQGGDLLLDVHVRPNARTSDIEGLHGAALAVRVQAPARDNRANEAVCATLAKAFAVAHRRVSIERGHSSRRKSVRIEAAPSALPDWFTALGGGPA